MTSWKSLRRAPHRSPEGNSDNAQSVLPVLSTIGGGQESDSLEWHLSHSFAIGDRGCDLGLGKERKVKVSDH